ncbi:ras-related protein Rab-17 isoform X1 [Coturnix japonica]|uniref:ras-related protein Rab-17 isoform X1 n=1 Tax=Coturnix japonica TaxID=93934 RepID=UPI000777709E|nr:ras-related protein Rab-17 isoform X1 [Coturnix japonica]
MAQPAVPGSSLGDNRPTYIYKMVLLGSTSVGKSSLAYRYVKNDFKESLPTVGCSFFTQLIHLETATIKLEIWDTAGQEKYHSVCHLYYRGAHAALLVYDLTNKETLSRAKQWLIELEKEFLPDEIVIALVGNKKDLAEEREVATEDGEEFARSRSLLFMETSAKSNHQPKSSCGMKARRQPSHPRAVGSAWTCMQTGQGEGAAMSEEPLAPHRM